LQLAQELAESSTQGPLWLQLAQEPLKPQEQLAIVLPMDSWHLLRNAELRRAPALLPQFWPKRFGFMSLGKSWMWECEADIPILTPGRLRFALKT
jgi:5'-3' exonuclease